ncbi:MAG TPA: TolC family protein [Acidobacteriota bacterium]|nr:TolC family protein [Acidobacteriota bacterium]
MKRILTLLPLILFAASWPQPNWAEGTSMGTPLALVRAEAADALRLSLRQAVEMALSPHGNLQVEAARAELDGALARTDRSRSALLPHLRAALDQSRLTRNLQALGLRDEGGTFRPPDLVGPFSTFDARLRVEQTVFDWSAIKSLQAAKASLQGTRQDLERVRDLVAAEVSRLYLDALRARADVEAAQADVDLARSLLDTASRRRESGTGIRIEETRAAVQLSNQQQRLLVAQNRMGRAYLRLQRAIGADIGMPMELTDSLQSEPSPLMDAEQARQAAAQSRADLKALEEKVRSDRKRVRASWARRLPVLEAFADYGASGIYPNDSLATWTAGLHLEVPIFQGGRIGSEEAEERAALRRRQALLEDLRREIELEVRLAVTGALLAGQQVEVAEQGLNLAQEELERARRRYRSGVTGSLEVTQAQTNLERARENLNSALFEYGSAQVDLQAATGTILRDLGVAGGEEEPRHE